MIRRIPAPTRHTSRRREAFTLLEVLVVVAILVILASVATFSYFRYIEDAKEDSARQTMKLIEQQCKNYTVKSGGTPPPTLAELLQPSDGGPPFLEGGITAITDPWGKQYQYQPEHVNSQTGVPDPIVFTTIGTNPGGRMIYALGRTTQ